MAQKAAAPKPPTLAPDRALKALTQQLDRLQKLKKRNYQEAEAEETEWAHVTQGIIEAAFGDTSPGLNEFLKAKYAGLATRSGLSLQQQYQVSFDSRGKKREALLQGMISLLRLQLPEEEIKGVYEPGDQYAFYRDLSSLMVATTQDIFIIDAYLDEQVFNLYVGKVPATAMVRILSNRIGSNVQTVAKMYASKRPLELRSSGAGHDRTVFIDQRGWVIGQSIKDAARKNPTYMIELDDPLLSAARNIYSSIWAAAAAII